MHPDRADLVGQAVLGAEEDRAVVDEPGHRREEHQSVARPRAAEDAGHCRRQPYQRERDQERLRDREAGIGGVRAGEAAHDGGQGIGARVVIRLLHHEDAGVAIGVVGRAELGIAFGMPVQLRHVDHDGEGYDRQDEPHQEQEEAGRSRPESVVCRVRALLDRVVARHEVHSIQIIDKLKGAASRFRGAVRAGDGVAGRRARCSCRLPTSRLRPGSGLSSSSIMTRRRSQAERVRLRQRG